MAVEHMYDSVGPDNSVKRRQSGYDLRFFFRFEMELLLRAAGLTVRSVYSDYDRSEYKFERRPNAVYRFAGIAGAPPRLGARWQSSGGRFQVHDLYLLYLQVTRPFDTVRIGRRGDSVPSANSVYRVVSSSV